MDYSAEKEILKTVTPFHARAGEGAVFLMGPEGALHSPPILASDAKRLVLTIMPADKAAVEAAVASLGPDDEQEEAIASNCWI